MKDEYIILNKTTILNKIDTLLEERGYEADNDRQSYLNGQITALNSLVLPFNSISLIPEIEKAFDAGYDLNTFEQLEIPNEERDCLNTQDYINNLKLEI